MSVKGFDTWESSEQMKICIYLSFWLPWQGRNSAVTVAKKLYFLAVKMKEIIIHLLVLITHSSKQPTFLQPYPSNIFFHNNKVKRVLEWGIFTTSLTFACLHSLCVLTFSFYSCHLFLLLPYLMFIIISYFSKTNNIQRLAAGTLIGWFNIIYSFFTK